MESKVAERFRREWPKPIPEHERIVGFLTETYRRYREGGLADSHFDNELATGSEYVYRLRVGELLLADALWNGGFKLSSADEGPDFFAEKNRRKNGVRFTYPPFGSEPDPVPVRVSIANSSIGLARESPRFRTK